MRGRLLRPAATPTPTTTTTHPPGESVHGHVHRIVGALIQRARCVSLFTGRFARSPLVTFARRSGTWDLVFEFETPLQTPALQTPLSLACLPSRSADSEHARPRTPSRWVWVGHEWRGRAPSSSGGNSRTTALKRPSMSSITCHVAIRRTSERACEQRRRHPRVPHPTSPHRRVGGYTRISHLIRTDGPIVCLGGTTGACICGGGARSAVGVESDS